MKRNTVGHTSDCDVWAMCRDLTMPERSHDDGRWMPPTRRVPLTPLPFTEELQHRQFIGRGDRTSVVELYTRLAGTMMLGITELNLENVGCGADWAVLSLERHLLFGQFLFCCNSSRR